MRSLILLIVLQYSNEILCQSQYGYVYPIPLRSRNDDLKLCSNGNRVYPHWTNCSLFHLCHFGISRTYSCMNGYFFNPETRQCQYLPVENEINCVRVREQFHNPVIELVRGFDHFNHRKSLSSTCTESGIYPDELDCSLFHHCHENRHHEIVRCPNELRFDPKTYLCLPSQLVNCQYEPLLTHDDDEDHSTCQNYAPGTYLPKANRFDAFIICGENGTSVSMYCQSGFVYNALTTTCERGPCTFDSSLCRNEGQCVDNLTIDKGFQCLCKKQFHGDFCEKRMHSSLIRLTGISSVILIALILLASIVFAIIVFIRLIIDRNQNNWRSLREESSV